MYRALILPILLYGAETWTLLKADLSKLEVFRMRCLRRILRVSLRDRMQNDSVRMACSEQATIDEEIQKRRLRWFGHVCRMDEHRFPYRPLWRRRPQQWKIQRSAPKKTWLKQIEDDLRNRRISVIEAKQMALNRTTWRTVIREVRQPLAPTAAYWLRNRPRPGAR